MGLSVLDEVTIEPLHEGLEEVLRGVLVGNELAGLLGEGGDLLTLQPTGHDVFEPRQVIVTVEGQAVGRDVTTPVHA